MRLLLKWTYQCEIGEEQPHTWITLVTLFALFSDPPLLCNVNLLGLEPCNVCVELVLTERRQEPADRRATH